MAAYQGSKPVQCDADFQVVDLKGRTAVITGGELDISLHVKLSDICSRSWWIWESICSSTCRGWVLTGHDTYMLPLLNNYSAIVVIADLNQDQGDQITVELGK